jgi:FdhD protein
MVASVSAPTALAVDVAQRIGITLVGFLRRETMTIYTGEGRIADLQ